MSNEVDLNACRLRFRFKGASYVVSLVDLLVEDDLDRIAREQKF